MLEVKHEATFSVGVSDLLPQSVLPRIVTGGWWLVAGAGCCVHTHLEPMLALSLEPGAG